MMEYKFGSYGVVGYGGNILEGFLADMPLVGSNLKPSSSMCNVFSKNLVCKNSFVHSGLALPSGVFGGVTLGGVIPKGKAVVRPHAYHCFDPLCPECCLAWAKRAAKRAERRFRGFLGLGVDDVLEVNSVRHVTVSVPRFDYDLSFSDMRKKAVVAALMVGVDTGLVMYHPKRFDKVAKIWRFRPHFHILGFVVGGWLPSRLVKVVFEHSGYIVRNLEKRKSVYMTLLYQLSHAGVAGRKKTVNYFGDLAQAKKNGLEVECKCESLKCPVCGEVMKLGVRVASAVPFNYPRYEDCFVLDDVDNWCIVEFKKRFSKAEDEAFSVYESG